MENFTKKPLTEEGMIKLAIETIKTMSMYLDEKIPSAEETVRVLNEWLENRRNGKSIEDVHMQVYVTLIERAHNNKQYHVELGIYEDFIKYVTGTIDNHKTLLFDLKRTKEALKELIKEKKRDIKHKK